MPHIYLSVRTIALTLLFFAALCSAPSLIFSQEVLQSSIVEGRVIDSASGEAVVGALIRVIDAAPSTLAKGTYSTNKGFFRLIFPANTSFPVQIRVMSLGYKPLEYRFSQENTTASVSLKLIPSPISFERVEVRALTAEEIIRKAIEARSINAGNLISSSKMLYTKITGFGTVKLPFRDEQRQEAIVETISRVEDTFAPKREQKTTILQRRQTANVPAASNVFTFNEFFNIQDDYTKIGSARLTTPLSSNAPNVYLYQYIEQRADGNGGVVYIIDFKPRSSALPGFEGRLHISGNSFAVTEADIRPTQVSIPFVERMQYKQKYSEFTSNGQTFWQPTFLQFFIKAGTQAGFGAIKAGGEFTAQTIAQDIRFNAASAPSRSATTSVNAVSNPVSQKPLKLSRRAIKTTVEAGADSTKTEFWQKNSLYALTDEELATYRRVDSVQVIRDSIKRVTPPKPETERRSGVTLNFSLSAPDDTDDAESNDLEVNANMRSSNQVQTNNLGEAPPMSSMLPFSPNGLIPIPFSTSCTLCPTIGINPLLNFTRTTNLLYGIELLPQLVDTANRSIVAISLRGAFEATTPAFRQFWWETGIMSTLAEWEQGGINVYGGLYSRVQSIQERRLISPLLQPYNLNSDYLIFDHHFDYFREEGWTAGVGLKAAQLRISAAFQDARQTSLYTTAERAQAGERANLAIQDGHWQTWRADADWNYSNILSTLTIPTSERFRFGIKLFGETGEEIEQRNRYFRAGASTFALLPTFESGYTPMFALATASVGIADENTPLQKQFIAMRRYTLAGATNDLLSVPINDFGGTQFLQVRLEHNFTDVWWRALGLPLYNQRGVEASIFCNAATYRNQSVPASILRSTPNNGGENNGFYTEAGFALDRIPTFLLDFLFLRFDAAWGIGADAVSPDGVRNFGFSFSTRISF